MDIGLKNLKAIKEQKNILKVDVCMIPHKKKW